MAIVTITFEDAPDGDVKVKMESDPPLPGPAAYKKARKAGKPIRITDAQQVGMEFMRQMAKPLDEAYESAEDE